MKRRALPSNMRTCSRCDVHIKVIIRRLGIMWCPGCDSLFHFCPERLERLPRRRART